MRWILPAGWAVLLGAGYFWMGPPKKQPEVNESSCRTAKQKEALPRFVALRPLPVNHRVNEPDLDWRNPQGGNPDRGRFESQYLACAVAAGDSVVEADLEPAPVIKSEEGRSSYHLELPAADARKINAGYEIDVFTRDKPLLRDVPVLATRCEAGKPATCFAILDLTPQEGALLMGADTTQITMDIKKRPEVKRE